MGCGVFVSLLLQEEDNKELSPAVANVPVVIKSRRLFRLKENPANYRKPSIGMIGRNPPL